MGLVERSREFTYELVGHNLRNKFNSNFLFNFPSVLKNAVTHTENDSIFIIFKCKFMARFYKLNEYKE
jgi:hypothetical protein